MSKKRIILICSILFTVLIFGFVYKFSHEKIITEKELRNKINIPIDTYNDVMSTVIQLEEDKEAKYNIDKIENLKDKKKFDKKLRKKIIELLHMPLPLQEQIKVTQIEAVDKGKYTQNKIKIHTSSVTRMPAYLLIPKNAKSPAPAVIAMHQHGGFYECGKDETAGNKCNPELAYGKELAERGYVVLITDAPLFGERLDKADKNSPEVVEDLISQTLLVLNSPPLGIIVQEDLTSLEFLSSLEFVDKKNIGCIGHSFGGTRCNYLAGLDERIKATVMINSVAYFVSNRIIARTWFSILPGLGEYTGKRGLLSLIAPKAMMIVYTENDPIFPVEEARDIINSLNILYKKIGFESNIDSIYIPNESHTFPTKYHEETYQFLDRHLKNNHTK